MPAASEPSALPYVARTLMPREVRTNGAMAVALGALEGGLVGVVVKTHFAPVADAVWVNLCVALVAGSPAFANIVSLWISGLAEGRNKPAWVARLMAVTCAFLILMAFAPTNVLGLVLITLGMLVARLAWAGVITLRAAIWRANFPRQVRARITGWITIIYSLTIAATAAVIGLLMNWWPEVWRLAFPIAGVVGLAAAWRYQATRVRGGRRIQNEELDQRRDRSGGQLRAAFEILRGDRWYRRYMITMFAFGSGNLMVIALLVVLLNEQFGFERFQQVMITTALPLIMLSIFTPIWARRLDAVHILDYRARQAWMFVITMLFFLSATIFGLKWLFWVGALSLGMAFAGGKLGWNLGHNDFARDDQSTLYMGIHVTLTGVRGLIAPLVGVGVYQFLESLEAGLGRFVLLFPFLLTLGGAVTFVMLARLHRKEIEAS
ncbi:MULTISPECIES: MFS transporter [unclassified Wenzhouxiangella]|uniref:MFS transporter n=1 Tax=unclassified Wenzhouxiangella TaxID=2613841 RepID=UPI000E3276FA|nr:MULTISPECIES: MFS transporter [unclassified Wenzhouxiangella]RFF26602.1 MFS transporter [Wenzhouxiangella sp. 15181]RFP67649.1 MFS transporter [Wenzhouxiangella sp. 15190]